MHDFSQRGDFIQTYWKDTPSRPTHQPSKDLYGIGIGPKGTDVLLGSGFTYGEALRAAQAKIAADFPGKHL